MALTPSGIVWEGQEWLRGDSLADLDAYLSRHMPREPDHRFVHPVCRHCGGDVFSLEGDGGPVARICGTCNRSDDPLIGDAAYHYICDSEDGFDGNEADCFACPCRRSSEFRLSVGFWHTDVEIEPGRVERLVKWIYVGGMCARCHVVGLYAEWRCGAELATNVYDLA